MPVPGEDGMQAADVLHFGEQPVVLRVRPVKFGLVKHPLQVRHDLDVARGVRQVLDGDRPQFDRVALRREGDGDGGTKVIAEVTHAQRGLVPSYPERLLAFQWEVSQHGPRARRLTGGSVYEKEHPPRRVEQVVGTTANIVAARTGLAG